VGDTLDTLAAVPRRGRDGDPAFVANPASGCDCLPSTLQHGPRLAPLFSFLFLFQRSRAP
jgi:hypothetical protein